MNTNESTLPNALEDVVMLGVASEETKGPDVGAEDFGLPIEQGITSE